MAVPNPLRFGTMANRNDEGQVQIRLVTKQQTYAIPDVPYSVPAKIDHLSLNKLLNQLLKDSGGVLKDVEFDFLVQNELLRVPLSEHLQERGTSTEATVEVEYLERTPAPEPQDSILHDDWVASVKVCDKLVLTGHYDNTVAIHTTKSVPVRILKEHTDRIRAVSWINDEDPAKGFITTSHDLSAILWHWDASSKTAESRVVFKGHERGIDSVGVSPNAERFATGGWDTHLKIWSASFDYNEDEPASKRIKGVHTRVPLHTLKGHKETIAATVWTDPYNICTASMDHTIKFWDAEVKTTESDLLLPFSKFNFLIAVWSKKRNSRPKSLPFGIMVSLIQHPGSVISRPPRTPL